MASLWTPQPPHQDPKKWSPRENEIWIRAKNERPILRTQTLCPHAPPPPWGRPHPQRMTERAPVAHAYLKNDPHDPLIMLNTHKWRNFFSKTNVCPPIAIG